MAFDGPTSFGLLLIAVGLALLGASYRISRLARDYRARMEALLDLARKPLDPLDIPAAAWNSLSAAGWQRVCWQGSWFGQPVAGELGTGITASQKPDAALAFELASGDDVRLSIEMVHATAWGENRLFAEHLARVFVLLVETRLHARTEALAAALAERAHLSLYLQHDMRNLAQWVSWVSDDFIASDKDSRMIEAARRLRDNAPLARERAQRLMLALAKQPGIESAQRMDLRQAAMSAARLAGFEPEIVGDACAWIAPEQLARALDNLFSNLASAWRMSPSVAPRLVLRSREQNGGAQAELEFHCAWRNDIMPVPAEKLFEPFASGRAGGLGLGLYQARKSLREAGGELSAQQTESGVCFLLRLPAPAP
jgi:signal transduction histidine kinase